MARGLFEIVDSQIARGPRSLRPCIAIEPAAGAPRAMGWLAPWSALAVAAALRERGRDAVVLFDGVDEWCPRVPEARWHERAISQLDPRADQCCATALGSGA